MWNEPLTNYNSPVVLLSVPVYGLCKDSSATQFTSCYSVSSSASLSTVVMVSGTYTVAAKNTDYSFSSDSTCNLDEANGSK